MGNYRKKTTYDKILEVIAISALVWAFYPLLFYYNIDSDALLPTHFNLAGEADGWGGRSILWIIPPIALLFYIRLSVLQKFPKIYNYPCKITEQNADYLYKMGEQLIRHIKVSVVLMFAFVSNDIYAVITGKLSSPNLLVIGILVAIMLLSIIIYIIKMKRYKPELYKN